MTRKTVILGAEYDSLLREALSAVVEELGGKALSREWSLGGSQEIFCADVEIGLDILTIESETYVGVSISGPTELVEKVQYLVDERRSGGFRPL